MYDILELNKKLLAELRDIAKDLKIKRVESFRKQDLIYKILDAQAIVVSESKAARKEGSRKENQIKEGTGKEKQICNSDIRISKKPCKQQHMPVSWNFFAATFVGARGLLERGEGA